MNNTLEHFISALDDERCINMRVFVQCDENGMFRDYDHFNAYTGFKEMGFEIIFFSDEEKLRESSIEDVIVGYGGPIRARLKDYGLVIPNIDYPDSISKYLGRKIWKSTINTINSNPDLWNVFVKPVINKSFKGRTVRSAKDLIGCGSTNGDQEIYVSELLEFVSEYRVFVRYGRILDMRHYYGAWDVLPDVETIKKCIADYVDSPKAYAIDFGVTNDGKTVFVEINVSGSIGSYGLEPISYAKFMAARWAELTGTEDECSFDI